MKGIQMKKVLVAAALALLASNAMANQTTTGGDPSAAPDVTYKSAQKSSTAGVSDAILAAGELLSYDYANTPTNAYVVTRVGGGVGVPEGATMISGISTKAVATGDTGYFLMQIKGFATVKYDATAPITRGLPLCANSVGAAVRCTGQPASASKVIAMEAKASGTGTDLKVMLSAD